MSIRVLMEIFCDGCGKCYGASAHTSEGIQDEMWTLKLIIKDRGWIVLPRGCHPQGHFCLECSDKPIPEISKQKTLRWTDAVVGEALRADP